MLFVSNLTKIFGQKKVAVDNISFEAKTGEIIGFLGPNGAGKTTTMRLILGFLKPSSGVVLVDSVSPFRERIKVLRKIGYLPENNPLYGDMKVCEYLNFSAKIKRAGNQEEIITQVGLTDVLNQKIDTLSRGFRQRVGLAGALLGEPKILILDEPTSGLDPLEQEKIKVLIKKLSRNKIVIFSTHILSEAEDISDRLIIINKGKIVYDGKKPKGKGNISKLFKKLIKN
ncbi:MAG: ABC transporter ATP-binding protein [Patescibacteria group bacterium]|nr:ABC transporter ATP-binding protein [Patescibacteria group bacterium]